ncbi:MAG: hypothetical protein KGQ38_04650 [Actinomycetales bacterium]|nr:hypothetical protein [Actinomycetales bacterium]
MGLFSKTDALPKQLRTQLNTGERVMAWSELATGFVVATDQRLLVFSGKEPQSELIESRSWQDAISAGWNDPTLDLVFSADSAIETLLIDLPVPGLVPAVVRDRVTGAIVFDRVVEISDLGKVRFIARRTDSSVDWVTMPLSAIPNTATSKSAIESALISLRSTLGI